MADHVERRLKLEQAVDDLRGITEDAGWEFRIASETPSEIVYETRRTRGSAWRQVRVAYDGDAMAKFALSVGARGQARTTTVRAFPHEEISKIAASLP